MRNGIHIFAVCTMVVSAGCYDQAVQYSGPAAETNWNEFEEYTVRAGRIEAPDSVPAGERVEVRVWAHLGPNGCYKFGRFEVRWDRELAIVDVVGIRRKGPVYCTQAPTEMRGVTLMVTAPDLNAFELVFNRNALDEIRHVVRVEGIRPN